ncbi:MAG: cardiolipin synthase [Clostridiales bacterium]|nr:cardiolipin synthase [Clostridiales bacterium]
MSVSEIVLSIFLIIFVANVALAALTIFFEHRNPASTWAWLMVITFVPIFGFLCYLIFGREGKKEKTFKKKAENDIDTYFGYLNTMDKYSVMIQAQKTAIEERIDIIDHKHLNDLAYLHISSGNWITYDNTVKSYFEGNSKFEELINDIRGANKFIHMEYYILRGDDLGKRIVAELTKKAAEGVEVRLLIDAQGNQFLPKHFFDELKAAGGKVGKFLPPLVIRLNYRDHRKIAVIDGKIGYVGGLNIGDEYLGKVKRYGKWRDTHIRIEGDAVDQLQLRFIMDWNFVCNNEIVLSDKYFPADKNNSGNVKMQIVSSGPDTRQQNIRNGYFKMINEAEHHVYVTTPYFVPDDGIFAALKVAALSGIDVRIIIPANPDHPFVYWSSMSYLGELLESGVKCYQYNDGFVHSKTVYVDGYVTSVGTANMDIRSFDLNFETNAFIYDKKVTEEHEKQFLKDIESCTEITLEWYSKRSAVFKIREAVARLISPML